MARDAGQPNAGVGESLAERAPQFAFLQAMWLLHRAYPGAVGMGYQGPPAEELLRLRPSASLAFPPGDIESFESLRGRPPYRLTTTFMGLYGAHSPLPSFYSEEILMRCSDDPEHSLRAFFDLFNHRLLAFLYRGIIKYRGHLLYRHGGTDEFSWRLFAVAGLSPDGVTSSTQLEPQRLLRFAGLLSQTRRPAASMVALLRSWFGGLPVAVQQCVPRWVYLDHELRSHLGQQACRLGDDATIGGRIRDWTGKFRVTIGPVDFDTYCRFLPGRDDLVALKRLVRTFLGDSLDHDLKMVIRTSDAPRLAVTLGRQGHLGWTAGLVTRADCEVEVVFA